MASARRGARNRPCKARQRGTILRTRPASHAIIRQCRDDTDFERHVAYIHFDPMPSSKWEACGIIDDSVSRESPVPRASMRRFDRYEAIGVAIVILLVALWVLHFVLPAPPPTVP
jgi:hypothetical protein